MKCGFIYLWKDIKRNKFYLGSHIGSLDDGYIGSNKRLKCSYKSRPHTFKRRILEFYENITHKDLLSREQAWLSLIDINELGKKYYNEKRVAAGGDIISELSEERRAEHKRKSVKARQDGARRWRMNNPDKVSENAKYANSQIKNRHKLESKFGDDNPFYGKKHSEETRNKMSEKAKSRKSNRVGAKQTEETKRLIRLNNPNRKSIMTPYGLFVSADEFANKIKIVSANSVRKTMSECDVPISKMKVRNNGLFKEEDIGKTPRSLGYYYIEKDCHA